MEKRVKLSWKMVGITPCDRGVIVVGGDRAVIYISRKKSGRGLKSVVAKYKAKKITAAVKLFENSDTTMSAVRKFEEKAVQIRCHSVIKDDEK